MRRALQLLLGSLVLLGSLWLRARLRDGQRHAWQPAPRELQKDVFTAPPPLRARADLPTRAPRQPMQAPRLTSLRSTPPALPPPPTPRRELLLPVDSPCVELDDLRDAALRCDANPAARRAGPPSVGCPRSKEKVCREHAAVPNCSGIVAAASQPTRGDGVLSRSRRARTLAWHDVVFGIATFDSAAEHALLQAAADTWLRLAEGADLLITTDGDDPRPDDEAQQYIRSGSLERPCVEATQSLDPGARPR
jgi:hypothetical protein